MDLRKVGKVITRQRDEIRRLSGELETLREIQKTIDGKMGKGWLQSLADAISTERKDNDSN
jgi:hypothetical protein